LAGNSFIGDDGKLGFTNPTADDIPDVTDPIGSNFFDRTEQVLHVNLAGNQVVRIVVAKTLVVEFDSTNVELTADELYDSPNLIQYLASILGIDPSNIKVVNVVAENQDRRRRRRREQGFNVHSRGARNAIPTNTIVLEIDNSVDQIDEATTVAANNDDVLEANTAMAETIIAATLNNELPEELELLPQVSMQVVTPPVVPECMADCVAANADTSNADNADYMPGADCSLAGFYNVPVEELSSVVDTDSLPTYEENTEDEDEELKNNEGLKTFVAPTGWEVALEPAAGQFTIQSSLYSIVYRLYSIVYTLVYDIV